MLGEANESDIHIDGVICPCLVDTGSMVTTVGESFYRQHLSHIAITSMDNLLKIEGATGHEVPYLGYIEAPVSSKQDCTGLCMETTIPILVVPDTSYNRRVPIVMGTNFIRVCRDACRDRYGTRYLQKTKTTTPWYLAYQHLSARDRFLGSDGTLGIVATSQRITVEPRQKVTLWGVAHAPPRGDTFTSITSAIDNGNLPNSLMVTPAIVNLCSDGSTCRVPVEVTNLSD